MSRAAAGTTSATSAKCADRGTWGAPSAACSYDGSAIEPILQCQIEQSAEVLDFLRDKFTSNVLYVWMQKETAALHRKVCELALSAGRQAQRAFNNERGHTTRSFLSRDAWDDLHEGLLAGDRLQLALKEMEKAYYDENCCEYELAKHISLR